MKKYFVPVVTLALVLMVQAAPAWAQKKALTAEAADPRLFAVEDLRPGMKGVARTVFSGTEPEEFGVEILGVLPGFPGPRQSAIIARLSGANVDKTSVFAGMSGSPVYIDGRLAGAIAFMLFLIADLDNPFHGDWRIRPDSIVQAVEQAAADGDRKG